MVPAEIVGLIGVVLGWSLGLLTEAVHSHFRRRRLVQVVEAELRSLHFQINDKLDIIDQMRDALREQRILRGVSVRSLRVGYDKHVSEIYGHLPQRKRTVLHVVHEKMRVVDESMESFESEFVETKKEGIHKDAWARAENTLNGIQDACEKAQSLIKQYLDGKPPDVFWEEHDPEEVRVSRKRSRESKNNS